MTVENVQNENLRLLHVAAQSADIDLKINCAIIETMKIYRRVLGTAWLGIIPTVASIHKTASTISLGKAIVQCFGLPRASYRSVYELVKRNLWDDLDHEISVVTPSSSSAVALTSLEVLGVALTGGVLNIPLVVIITTRLILILARDLILILVRACKETTFTCAGHPQLKDVDVENAASYYRPSSSKVHKEILGLVPKRNLMITYSYDKVRLGLEETLYRWIAEITKDVNSSRLDRSRGRGFSSDRI